MKNLVKKVGILTCLALLFLFVSQVFAPWQYNPFTRKLDYYSMDVGGALVGEANGDILYYNGTNWTNFPIGANTNVLTVAAGVPTWVAAGAPGVHAASHELLGADLVDHDNLTNFVAAEHLLVGAIDHDSLLNYVAGQHLVLPGTIVATLTDHDLAAHTGLGLAITAHAMATHSDEDTYDISTTGDIHHGGFISTPYYSIGNSGATITIDWNNGNLQYITLTAVGVDVTFTEPPNPGKCELWIIQDGTGDRTIDWEHEISPEWPGNVEPTLSTGAADVDVVVFTFIGGTTYRGLFNGNFE